MKAGRLAVRIHEADCCQHLDHIEGEEVFCAAHIENYGKLCTEARPCEQSLSFDEELNFKIGPRDAEGAPRTLQLMLYKQKNSAEDRELLGMGSLLIEDIEEGQKLTVNVPLVDKIGKHSGGVKATCRYYPSRSIGKNEIA